MKLGLGHRLQGAVRTLGCLLLILASNSVQAAQPVPSSATPDCIPGSAWDALHEADLLYNVSIWSFALEATGLNLLLQNETTPVTLFVPLDSGILGCAGAVECGQEDTYWRGSLTSPESVGLLLLHWVNGTLALGQADDAEPVSSATLLSQVQGSSAWDLSLGRNGSDTAVVMQGGSSAGVEQSRDLLDTLETCSGSTIYVIAAPMVPTHTPNTDLNKIPGLQDLCWSNIWSAFFHAPGEQSLYDPSGSYLLYFLFQSFYTGTWPDLPNHLAYSNAASNISFLIPEPAKMNDLTAQFGEIPATDPLRAYALSGLYTLPGGYCPHGLVEAGQVNTMLGEMLGQDVAYTVEPGASEDEVIFILPGDDAGSPVAARLVTTACFSSAWILNDTLWVWDDLADIPALSSAQAFPTVPQDDLFHAAADCGQQDDVVQLTAAGGGTPAPAPAPASEGGGLSGGAIAGIVVGSVAGAAALLALAFILLRRRRRLRDQPQHLAEKSSTGSGGEGASPFQKSSQGTPPAPKDGGLDKGALAESSPDQTTEDYETLLSLAAAGSDLNRGLVRGGGFAFDVDPSTGARRLLGEGRFGRVYAGHSAQGEELAVKCIGAPESGVNPLHRSCSAGLVDEIKVLMRCRSKYIVAFMGVVVDEGAGEVQILTERMPGGNLWRALRRGEVTWERNGWRIARDVACGLVIFSSRRIVHNDLKSSNILLAGDGTAKISDVGLAHIISDSQSYLATQAAGGGTVNWCAPETILGQPCTVQSDMFSYGVVLWELATGEAPVRGSMRPVRAPEECPVEVWELMQRCWAPEPDDRPCAREALDLLERLYGAAS